MKKSRISLSRHPLFVSTPPKHAPVYSACKYDQVSGISRIWSAHPTYLPQSCWKLATRVLRTHSDKPAILNVSSLNLYLFRMLFLSSWGHSSLRHRGGTLHTPFCEDDWSLSTERRSWIYNCRKRIKELLKSESMLSSTPQNLLEPAYPHLSAGFADRTLFQEPNNFPFMQSLPFALPEIPDPVDDWFAMPQSSMHVSASYPPQSHHYLDYSNQPTWSGRLCNDVAPPIYDNRPPHRPLNRTYSIDNFNLQSYPTVPVPVPPTGQMTCGWEPQALTMQTDRPAVPRNGYELPSQPIDIPRPMHGQTQRTVPRLECGRVPVSFRCYISNYILSRLISLFKWNSPGYDHPQFNGRFEQSSILLTGGPRDFPYSTAQ